jgi:hypothetical protein
MRYIVVTEKGYILGVYRNRKDAEMSLHEIDADERCDQNNHYYDKEIRRVLGQDKELDLITL